MLYNANDAYLESRVFSADGVELVRMLYQAATAAVEDARRHLAEKDIAMRSKKINKALRILTELATSLDHERGGELSHRLAGLYDYMSRRLIEGNMRQEDQPLEEVLGLLRTLLEGWTGIQSTAAPAARENRWEEVVPESLPQPGSYGPRSHAWSF